MENNSDERIGELLTVLKAQSDLISGLFTQSMLATARLETILAMQREILVLLGMDREKVKEKQAEIHAHLLVAARQEMQQTVESALQSPESSEDSSDNNGGHHLN